MSLYPQFAKPNTTEQASQLLSGLSTGAVIIAGGQEIMPSVNYGHLMPSVYVDINSLSDLEGISFDNNEGADNCSSMTSKHAGEIVQSLILEHSEKRHM